MSCRETQNLIHGYLDGELDLVRTMEMEAHLQVCAACAQLYAEQQGLRSAIHAHASYFKSPAGLQSRVRAAMREEGKASAAPRVVPQRAPWRLSWQALGLAATVAVVALLAWVAVPSLRGPSPEDRVGQEVLSSHIRSLMASHLTDVTSSDQHTVKPWFDGKLDFAPPVGDFAAEGFPLVGGRLDYLGGRPVAALVYQRRKHSINLFVWPAASGSDEAAKATTLQGYNLVHWTRAGMTYWGVSDLSMNQLQEFAQLVQK